VAETAKDLVGTWTLVSITREQDGKKTDYFGPNPQGQLIFAPKWSLCRNLSSFGYSQIRVRQS
jgi:hypothetical protein